MSGENNSKNDGSKWNAKGIGDLSDCFDSNLNNLYRLKQKRDPRVPFLNFDYLIN